MSHHAGQELTVYSNHTANEDVRRIEAGLGGMKRGPISKLWADVLALWGMVCDPLAAWTSKAVAVGALLYLVSPLDALPDLIPVIGLSDDAGVLLTAVSSLCHELAKYRVK